MQPWGGSVTVQSAVDHHALGYKYADAAATSQPFALPQPLAFPKWQHVPQVYKHRHKGKRMVMFGLSPEDIAAGGHDKDR
jgi:hypothetical protein